MIYVSAGIIQNHFQHSVKLAVFPCLPIWHAFLSPPAQRFVIAKDLFRRTDELTQGSPIV